MTILLGPSTITDPARLLVASTHNIRCAGHLRLTLDPLERHDLVTRIIESLSRHTFDAIAFRGLSGALVAPTVAMMMGKSLLAVRKPDEDSHSSRDVEGDHAARRYVILDDFVACGGTIAAIHRAIKEYVPDAKCIGVLEYVYIGDRVDGYLSYDKGELDRQFEREVERERAKLQRANEAVNVLNEAKKFFPGTTQPWNPPGAVSVDFETFEPKWTPSPVPNSEAQMILYRYLADGTVVKL